MSYSFPMLQVSVGRRTAGFDRGANEQQEDLNEEETDQQQMKKKKKKKPGGGMFGRRGRKWDPAPFD